jgi:hypothetical protein
VAIHTTAEDTRISHLGKWIALNRSLVIVRTDLARGTVLHKTSGCRTLLLEHIAVLLAMDSFALLEQHTLLVMISQEESIKNSTALQPRPGITFFPASEMADC